MNLFRRIERVWQIDGIRPHQQLVLVYLAYRADERSLTCFPSAGRIAADTSMTRPGVQKVIRQLAKLGLITVLSSGRGKGRNAPNQYHLICLGMDNTVGHSDTSEWITAHKRMDNHKPVNGSPGWHEPLNHKRTVQSASAPAPEARAPRRPKIPEPGESPEEKEARQLTAVAGLFGWHPEAGEDERAYLDRVRRLNRKRTEAIT